MHLCSEYPVLYTETELFPYNLQLYLPFRKRSNSPIQLYAPAPRPLIQHYSCTLSSMDPKTGHTPVDLPAPCDARVPSLLERTVAAVLLELQLLL